MKTLTFLEDRNADLVQTISAELHRARAKHPTDMRSRHEGIAVLQEEVDELWDKIKEDASIEEVRAEVIQVAAMAVRFLQDIIAPEEAKAKISQAAMVGRRGREGICDMCGQEANL